MNIRAFLACNFSIAATRRVVEEVERRKAAVAGALGASGARVAWVPAANLHLTLKFLGSMREDAVEAVAGKLRKLAAVQPPIEARLRGVGAFPSLSAARVLWVGAEPLDALGRLAKAVDASMVELGFAAEERPFHPHVTVARIPDGADLKTAWTGDGELGSSLLNEIVVYESRTQAKGAEYVARARVTLGKKEN